jgi:3-hydroxyisobutyryl-CoA hydrolase
VLTVFRWAGIATHYIPSERLEAVESRLAEVDSHNFAFINQVLSEFESGPPKGYNFTITPEIQNAIDRIFAFNDLVSIIRNLESEAQSNSSISEWAQSTLNTLNLRSPTSLHVSLAAMRDTTNKSRYHTFQREYELASKFMAQPDFIEGVKARLIERREAKWSLPTSALKLSPSEVKTEIWEKGRFNETLEESFNILETGKRDKTPEERGLFKFALPMEVTVLATLIKGKQDGSEGESVKFTRKELVEFIVGENLGRGGLERKLNFILDRKTVEDDEGVLMWKFDDGHIE